jgi:hypothetical protein
VAVSAGTARIDVVLSGSPTQSISVNYATANGSATSGTDYVAQNGTLSWLIGDVSTRTILVPITSAGIGKQFSVRLMSSTDGASLGAVSKATISIAQEASVSGTGSSSSGAGGSSSSGSHGGSSSSGTPSGGSSSGALATSSSSSSGANSSSSSGASTPKTIVSIQLAGAPVEVFNKTTQAQGADNFPDAQVTAWRESDGTVNLSIPNIDTWRMRGSDLEHLTVDASEIYSSTNTASQITEDLHNYWHWMMGPYSLDGKTFYSLAHSEWYGCLLVGNCNALPSSRARTNSWANTIDSLKSDDGGATWQLNSVNGNHTVADAAYTWTGSQALASQIYLHALDHTGIFGPSRVVKQAGYYYSIAYYVHRNFSAIDPGAGVFEAPVDKSGFVILRTSDITNPNGWSAWTGGSGYGPVANGTFAVFAPKIAGVTLNAASVQLIYDTVAQCFILVHTLNQDGSPVYFSTTKSLANPAWSDAQEIVGTATLTTDPTGPVIGFGELFYPSILDDSSAGYNYEFTSSGRPQLFYSTYPSRNIYRVPLTITYK